MTAVSEATRMSAGWVVACVGLSLMAGAAKADDDAGLHGAVGLQVLSDNNLFRLPTGVSPPSATGSNDQRGDTVLAPFVTLSGTAVLAQQRFTASTTQRNNRMSHYSAYDTQTGDLQAQWDWRLGTQFDGRVDTSDTKQASDLRDFSSPSSNTVDIPSSTNVLDIHSKHASANWRPRPDRRITLDWQRYRGNNSLASFLTNDYAVRQMNIEGGWVTSLGTEWTLSYHDTDGHYPNRTEVQTLLIDNSYHQHDTQLGVVLRPGGRTRADLRAGYAVRHHVQVPQRDYSGPSGRAAIQWEASGSTVLNLEAVRDLDSLDDRDRLFTISTRYTAGAQTAFSAQWQVALQWSRQRIDYGGDPQDIINLTPARRDVLQNTQLTLTWLPVDRVQIGLSFTQEHRDSSQAGFQYSDRSIGLSSQYSF